MLNDFYRAFEDRFRGSRELIKMRLGIYLPFVLPLRHFYRPTKVVDVGCGRGEWLDLLSEHGFSCQGADIDDAMLVDCRDRGHEVHTADAVNFLQSLPDASQVVVSGFHIVEHLPFAVVQKLVQESLRVLKPGGLLILETPNPDNLVVGASSFYLDPSHQRPIPSQLLAFLPEYFGFKRYKILGLQESAELLREAAPSMFDVLSGVSPDYAVVAQKEGPPEIMDALNPPFIAEYGLSLKVLADTYQQQLDVRTKQAERHIQELAEAADRWVRQAEQAVADAKARASEAEARMMAAEARAHQAEERVRLAEGSVHLAEERANAESARAHQVAERAPLIEARADHAESRARAAEFRAKEHEHQQLALALQLEQQRAKIEELGVHTHHWWQSARVFEAECSALRNSWSWRLTAPLRMGATLAVRFWAEVHKGVNLAIFGGIHVLQRPLSRVMAAVLRRPELSHRIGQWLLRFPYLHQQLVAVARRRGVVPSFDTPPPSAAPVLDKGPVEVLENLTPRARQIHRDLQKALKNKR